MRSARRIGSRFFQPPFVPYSLWRYHMTTTATDTTARTFAIDKAHSEVLFQVRHLVTKVRGRFTDFNGTITFDPAHADRSSIAFTVNAASVDTATADRDQHLRSDDFFAVATFPTITFVS